MSTGFPRDGVCEKCMRTYTMNSPRSKYCLECKPIVAKIIRRAHYMATNGKETTRRHYSKLADELYEVEPLFLPYEEGVKYPSMCDKCTFVEYCHPALKRGLELPCFPNHPNHIAWRIHK